MDFKDNNLNPYKSEKSLKYIETLKLKENLKNSSLIMDNSNNSQNLDFSELVENDNKSFDLLNNNKIYILSKQKTNSNSNKKSK